MYVVYFTCHTVHLSKLTDIKGDLLTLFTAKEKNCVHSASFIVHQRNHVIKR